MESVASDNSPLEFAAVLEAEHAAGCLPAGESSGLAFSGGGIRSATFNLGVIQALAELRLLRRFDYLSTISGGGYIGAWLSMFIRRFANGDVARAEEEIGRRDGNLEHPAIRFLRAFSNYLTPRVGFTADTLTAVATYLRNLILTLAVLVTLLCAALIVPRLVVQAQELLVAWGRFDRGYWYEAVLVAVLLVATSMVALNLFYRPIDRSARWPWYTRSAWLVATIDVPVVAAAWIATCYCLRAAASGALKPVAWVASVTLVYFVLWLASVVVARLYPTESKLAFARFERSQQRGRWAVAFVLFGLLAGATGGLLLLGVAGAIGAVPEADRPWAAAALGPPAVLLAIALMVVAHIGLMARNFSEADRELWSRLGGRLLAIAVGWALVFAIALYGPAVLGFANQWVAAAGGFAWVASTLFGVFAGHSAATGKPDAKPWVELLTRIAPYVFVLGLLGAISWGLHRGLVWGDALRGSAAASADAIAFPGAGTPPWDQFLAHARAEYVHLRAWFDPPGALLLMLGSVAAAALVLSWRVNINLYSLHHFYRNRLARCYLGATNAERRPHPLTGFDPDDDAELAQLAGQKPLHIVGTAINLNRGAELAWQNRRAASFAFTPLHAGYQPASRQVLGGFRETARYGCDPDGTAIQLGAVMAISGAAASPNQGFHTSSAVAFLMTVFNVRLGHWCGNTRHPKAWRWRDPVFSLRYWWAELTGSANERQPFVSLSDGGHFENLGIYELVRRRCRLIVASDAGADPKYAFDDLAEARRKCYTDFGVEFRFKTRVDDIRPPREGEPGARHYALAEIVYPGGAPPGTLVYWKASLTADLPPDLTNYRRTHGEFPHESTADQFFDESQFESYRHLGYEVAMRSLAMMRERKELPEALS